MRCLNCTAEAEYKVLNTSSADQAFCATHIPGFLKRSKEFASRIKPINVEPKPKKKKEKVSVVVDSKLEESEEQDGI